MASYKNHGVVPLDMRCQNCGERIEDEFEAYARQACPFCDEPLNEKPMKR